MLMFDIAAAVFSYKPQVSGTSYSFLASDRDLAQMERNVRKHENVYSIQSVKDASSYLPTVPSQ